MNDVTSWLVLKSVHGVGNRLFVRLLKHFGSPEVILNAAPEQLMAQGGLPRSLAASISGSKPTRAIMEDLELVETHGGHIVTYTSAEYPALLREIHDPPPLLYVRGRLEPDSLNVAVVGSRNATSYGRAVTERLSRDLAGLGITIVSGMARGIDAAAHRGALAAGGRTVAVLGCGLGTVYPAAHKDLFKKICDHGAVISEFPFLAEPEAHHFPIRNRIISGLCVGTVIVEATHNSGSLITARLAAEQGREVFAVPGSVTSFKSMGTHSLIKDGAKLVEHAADIIEEINPNLTQSAPVDAPLPKIDVGPLEKQVLDQLTAYPVHIDHLVRRLSRPAGELAGVLLHLELKGLVIQTPGNRFSRNDQQIERISLE